MTRTTDRCLRIGCVAKSLLGLGLAMVTEVYNLFGRLSRPTKAFACLLAALVIGFIDHATGYEVSFSIFYLAPISLAAWSLGPGYGQMLALFSAFTWLAVDYTAGALYSHPFIPFWNSAPLLRGNES